MKQLPPLNSLRIFLQASRCESFTQAASRIHLTKGAVSHQIKILEDWLDVRLFIRNNDGIELTRHGAELKKTCETVFSLLEEKVYSLKNKTGKTTKINIGCSASLLRNIFFQNQKKIKVLIPEFQIAYDSTATIDSLLNNTVDIFLSREIYPSVMGLKEVMLFKDEIGLVTTRNYMDQHTQGITVCHALSRESAWDEWCITSTHTLSVTDELRFNTLYLALDAVRFGLGVAVAPWFMVETEINQGHLYAPFGFVECGTGTWLYHRKNAGSSVLQFIDSLKFIVNDIKVAPHDTK
jgi:LysR family glycine cleavage system transcriptional activator